MNVSSDTVIKTSEVFKRDHLGSLKKCRSKFSGMKRLLSRLGSFLKNYLDKNSNKDPSSFVCSLHPGMIKCSWKIRKGTKMLIDSNFNSALFLRIRDVSGCRTSASLTIETTTARSSAEISLPVDNGRVLLELGYKTEGGDFITLEYILYDLGERKLEVPKYADWFQRESFDIHQEMYELGRRGFSIGGSEGLMVDSESSKVSGSYP